jgi:chitin disaccharide deacetylase
MRSSIRIALSLALVGGTSIPHPTMAQQPGPRPDVLFRLDDVGMNHSVNMAIERVAKTGIPFSVSLLFACPWYQEAVAMLKKHPQVSVGVHLALNSEWRDYRWGPVLGAAAVPTLVDSNGYFMHSNSAFLAHKYDLGEVERELDAQMQRAMRSGLRIDYVDHHMGTAAGTAELRAIVERLAAKYKTGISPYFGELDAVDLFPTAPEQKVDSLVRALRRLDPGRPNLVVVHVAEDTPEMRALFDANYAPMNSPTGEPLTWKHRKAELEMMLSPEIARALRESNARLITYNYLVGTRGLASMKAPAPPQP